MEQQAFTESDIEIIRTGNGDRCLGVAWDWECPEKVPEGPEDYPNPRPGSCWMAASWLTGWSTSDSLICVVS